MEAYDSTPSRSDARADQVDATTDALARLQARGTTGRHRADAVDGPGGHYCDRGSFVSRRPAGRAGHLRGRSHGGQEAPRRRNRPLSEAGTYVMNGSTSTNQNAV
jgi:hypothetical protein